ncbi:sodium:proton antiporter [soil metagenome]
MGIYTILIVLICTSAIFSYINYRFIKMPFVIGLFFLSTILSLIIISSRIWHSDYYESIKDVIAHTDISEYVLNIMLGFLLFAGSLHTDWESIRRQWKPVALFALGGVILSTLVIAFLLYHTCSWLDVPLSFLNCLIFGALISPTDPIAVIGILTKANVSKKIEATIVGESLFNDGVGVVIFIALLNALYSKTQVIIPGEAALLFVQEALGGSAFGLLLGFVLHRLMRSIDNYETEVLLTLAFVMAGYALCIQFHLSGPLAMVIMGLFVGSYRKDKAMSSTTQEYVYKFWTLLDVILNAILFIAIAFVLVVIDFKWSYVFVSLMAVPVVLLARVLVVYFPNLLFPKFTAISNAEAKIVVWGGLRGGLSIALVLSLPPGESKEILTVATYFCVVFSILLQGLTIERLAKKILATNKKKE